MSVFEFEARSLARYGVQSPSMHVLYSKSVRERGKCGNWKTGEEGQGAKGRRLHMDLKGLFEGRDARSRKCMQSGRKI